MYQTDPPRPAKESLPTMYDLKSEDPKEPGLPDEFHIFQTQLLRETFFPPNYRTDEIFTASDLNLYYDTQHPLWYKRPDWFAVVGGSRLYEQKDLRLSYVIWQEGIAPFVVVELLPPEQKKKIWDKLQERLTNRQQNGKFTNEFCEFLTTLSLTATLINYKLSK